MNSSVNLIDQAILLNNKYLAQPLPLRSNQVQDIYTTEFGSRPPGCGIDATAGKKRSTRIADDRLHNAIARNSRETLLSRIDPKAIKLVSTGSSVVGTWGACAFGLPTHKIQRIRDMYMSTLVVQPLALQKCWHEVASSLSTGRLRQHTAVEVSPP